MVFKRWRQWMAIGNQTTMLSNLPPEIVTEMSSYLPYTDILMLRKVKFSVIPLYRISMNIENILQAFTCEDLRDATNAHAVWLNLAKEYVAQNPHSDLANTQSLGSLTTDQIREQFEKRLIVDHVWQLSNQIYPSVKRIGGPSSAITTIRIAPGGRWLFAGTDEYSVYYWDLDANNPELVLLAPSHGAGNTPGADNIVAAIDFLVEPSDPLSGFIIAWAERDSIFDRDCRTSGEFLHLWDVIPQENGMLIAKHLKTIPLPYNGFSTKLSFNDRLVARAMEGRVDVYWWRECTETSLVRCTVQFKKKPLIPQTNVCVIGCDGLLVFTRYQDRHKAQFFALEPESSEISQYGKAVSHATKMWSFRFSCKYHGREISRPYFDGANYYQIIAMHNGIFSLTIPASRPDEPSLTKVLDFDLHQRESDARIYGLGLNKGYCRVWLLAGLDEWILPI
ncbi:hypothetical protein AGABI1DRAFT_109780 [Agaricus bisporus var. burnettii JB137-S8]|uniref:F-box domain-containing protein n=1 Tax=Agaricus bisporus var. burnettii (strain JB137-S8 / ATCC MYA-4627 / FGSC 10392) TaxID=597362 RepID=K5XK38_AGABU|nr:uncharacterized protein AGABI1DRAFT_109780 [Agaricus bisporus var. burnettii JB137-S8]EKM74875.1 hypothetical protein AGABI1DRAFT_109780 [Agaricus bisporus var. burnettii JB137-S8]